MNRSLSPFILAAGLLCGATCLGAQSATWSTAASVPQPSTRDFKPIEEAPPGWNLSAAPTEGQLEARGLHGKWVWTLKRHSLRAAMFGPESYAWTITASPERPANRPEGVLPSDEIGAYCVGIESYPNERLLREINAKRGARLALYLRERFGWLGNQSTGNP